MKRQVMVWGMVLLCAGCMGRPARVLPPEIDAKAAGKAAIAQYDANQDGAISGEELDKAPALKAALTKIDTVGDGKVTADKITARIRQWQESRLGLTSLYYRVRMDGKPLADATVTLVPEEFLGTNIQKATGKTDARGFVALNIEKPPQPGLVGVAAGLYRVEVSKKVGGEETVPAKYNTETTLGLEVADDSETMGADHSTLELKSE